MLAFSTISHLGFLLLALSINSNSPLSIYAFIFYLLQYSISNLNVFIILISIGYSFYSYVNNSDNEAKQLKEVEKNNSPIQLISQLKGYFNINPLLSLSLAITIFSFVGIPPLMGFFLRRNSSLVVITMNILGDNKKGLFELAIANELRSEGSMNSGKYESEGLNTSRRSLDCDIIREQRE